jgi:hypothetical protein
MCTQEDNAEMDMKDLPVFKFLLELWVGGLVHKNCNKPIDARGSANILFKTIMRNRATPEVLPIFYRKVQLCM